MADPTTELAKEFLEFNDYLVRKETKFQKNKKLQGTPSDIDIIATRPNIKKIGELELRENIIGEAKNWTIDSKETLDEIYNDKFRFMDNYPEESWKQLRRWIWSKKYDRVIFCFATTEEVFKHALEKYNIKMITAGFMIKNLALFFKKSRSRRSYFPEQYNYNVVKTIMTYLYSCHRWKDKLTLEDLVWIDPQAEPRYRNSFLEINSEILENLVYNQSYWEIFGRLLKRAAKEYPSSLKSRLKSNKQFWNYLTGKNV
jgi:hypothetical protein